MWDYNCEQNTIVTVGAIGGAILGSRRKLLFPLYLLIVIIQHRESCPHMNKGLKQIPPNTTLGGIVMSKQNYAHIKNCCRKYKQWQQRKGHKKK